MSTFQPSYELSVSHAKDPSRLVLEALPARVRRRCGTIDIQSDRLVFRDIRSRKDLSVLTAAIQDASKAKDRSQLRYSVAAPLYSSSGRPWTAKQLRSLPAYDPTRKLPSVVPYHSDCRAKELIETLANSDRKPNFSDNREFYLTVSFSGWSDRTDRAVRRAVGRSDVGSGCGMGTRDISFEFSRLSAVRNALRNLSALDFKVRVYLSRQIFDDRGSWEDAVDIFGSTPPAKALDKLDSL